MSDYLLYLAVVAAGYAAGFINTLAGSGSLITLPLLMFAGLDANTANGTNRIGILLQNIVALGSFRKQQVLSLSEGVRYSIPALIGSVAGALFATNLDREVMEKVIAGLMLFMFFVIWLRPEAWVKDRHLGPLPPLGASQWLVLLAVGFYGGFVQVGVGFFLLVGLVMGAGVDLVKSNVLKLFIVLFYTPVALAVFMYYGQVDYKLGFILALGNALGAWTAARFALRWGARFIRWVLLAVILASSVKLMFF